jgi:hypothetical protein
MATVLHVLSTALRACCVSFGERFLAQIKLSLVQYAQVITTTIRIYTDIM